MTNYAYPLRGRYTRLLNIAAERNNWLIGVGRYSPWELEVSPPVPSILDGEIEELTGFIGVKSVVGVKRTDGSSDFAVDGITYKHIPMTVQSLREAICLEAVFEGSLDHSQLPFDSFRSLGLYRTTTAINVPTFISPNQITSATLMMRVNFPPVIKQSQAVETIRVIVDLTSGVV